MRFRYRSNFGTRNKFFGVDGPFDAIDQFLSDLVLDSVFISVVAGVRNEKLVLDVDKALSVLNGLQISIHYRALLLLLEQANRPPRRRPQDLGFARVEVPALPLKEVSNPAVDRRVMHQIR